MINPNHIRWLQRLSGYDESEIRRSIDRVERWDLPGLSSELGKRSGADGHLAATMLCQAVDWLVERGVDEGRLKTRLKRPDIWSMWAEIRAAGVIAELLDGVRAVDLDVPVGANSGRNTDFHFYFDGESDVLPIEFKALGLSQFERRFCAAWTPMLRSIKPTRGICTIHADIDTDPPVLNRKLRREMCHDTAHTAKYLPAGLRSVSATVIAAHGTQQRYMERLTRTVGDHLSQLPESSEGWIAFHWGNGAPLNLLGEAVRRAALPEHVRGVMFVGSAIVLDGRMHDVLVALPKDSDGGGEWVYHSKIEGFDPKPLLDGFDDSAGVRPTIIRIPGEGGLEELLARDGSEPLWPFNLLLAPDPAHPDGV